MLPSTLGHLTDPTPASDSHRTVGQRYTLTEPVGAGGMGTVWRSHDELLRRDVAIKEVIIPAGVPAKERDLLCERMLREARAAAALSHPAVVSIFDVVTDSNRPWIVMELLESRSIADIIRDEGPMSPQRVAEVGLAVLGALETAHGAGVLHRDVKPGNILVSRAGRVVLTDFGAARSPNDTPLTSTGLLLGSPQYIAPERARGRPFGPASDLFSLGSSLYAAVEGKPPFDRGDPLSTMTAVVCEPPDRMINAGELEPILMGLLAKDPANRWDIARATVELRNMLNLTADGTAGTETTGTYVDRDETAESEIVHKVGRAPRPRPSRKRRATTGVSDAGGRRSAPVRRGSRRAVTRHAAPSEAVEIPSEQTSSGSTTSGRHRRVMTTSKDRRSAKRARKAEERGSSWRHREHKSPIRVWVTLFALLAVLIGGGAAAYYFTTASGSSASATTDSP